MANARFLLRPSWLLSHLLVALLIVAMISLGLWQLRRLDERRARNDLIESRREQSVTPVDEVLSSADTSVDEARYRRVSATGTYDDDATVVVRNRTQDGVAGAWLVTPLELPSGSQVGVVRGFVGLESDGSAVDAPPDHEYLVRKGIGTCGTKLDDAERLVVPFEMLPAPSGPTRP